MKSYIEVFSEIEYDKALNDGYRLATNDEIKYYHQNILKGFHTGRIGELMVKEDFE